MCQGFGFYMLFPNEMFLLIIYHLKITDLAFTLANICKSQIWLMKNNLLQWLVFPDACNLIINLNIFCMAWGMCSERKVVVKQVGALVSIPKVSNVTYLPWLLQQCKAYIYQGPIFTIFIALVSVNTILSVPKGKGQITQT